MVFQADLELPGINVLLTQVVLTGTNGVEFLDEVKERMHRFDVGIRTVIFGSVFDQLPGRENAGKPLFLDYNGRVRLVVFERDVVFRLVFLDQAIFQQKRIELCFHDHEFDIVDAFDKQTCFPVFVLIFIEIGRNPLFDILRFPNIEELSVYVEMLIDPRFVRESFQQLFYVFGRFHLAKLRR